MRYAIISDIHANYEALSAVLARIENTDIDGLICLGDIVGYGAQPVACLETIMALGCDTIAGNHDWAAIGRLSLDHFNRYAREAVLWTRSQLSERHKEWLAALPLIRCYAGFAVAHGTFHQPEAFHYLLNLGDIEASFQVLKELGVAVGFVGHTHVPLAAFDTDPIRRCADTQISLGGECAALLNVGSVGQPRDHNPMAAFCMFDTDGGTAAIVRSSYDIDGAADKILAARLDPYLGKRLYLGH